MIKIMTRAALALATIVAAFASTPAGGDVKVEKVPYFNQPNCYKLSNGTVEVIITTDIGPRIIRYSFTGGDNILAEIPDTTVKTDFGDWKPYGGHRLWSAPEGRPRSYAPDNSPITAKVEGAGTIHLTQIETQTGLIKEMTVTLAPTGTNVTILHRITNKNLWAADLAPWALTIMNGGGTTIIPQEPFISHDEDAGLLPARPLVMWAYTDFSDTRWTLGKKYLRLKTDEKLTDPQKTGVANKQGWAGYYRDKTLFVKRFPYIEGMTYADMGCNNECYTAGTFMELETMGPMRHLNWGEAVEHTERWFLFKNVDIGDTETTLDAAVSPLIAQTK